MPLVSLHTFYYDISGPSGKAYVLQNSELQHVRNLNTTIHTQMEVPKFPMEEEVLHRHIGVFMQISKANENIVFLFNQDQSCYMLCSGKFHAYKSMTEAVDAWHSIHNISTEFLKL